MLEATTTVNKKTSFSMAAMAEFIKNGWLLSLDPGRVLIGWGAWRESSEALNGEGRCSLFAPDFYVKTRKPWVNTPNWDIVPRDFLASLFSTMSQGDVNLEISPGGVAEAQQFQWLEPEREDFNTAFTEIQKGFQSRGLKKALPVVFAKARVDFKSKQRIALLSRALAAPKELFGYGLWREIESGLSEGMVGATPEILFQARATSTGSEVETVAIAGTRGKNQPGGAEELMRDPKERHEHQVVIDDIAEVLKPLGEVHLSETRVLELPTLFHLHTPIRLRSGEQIDFNRLVKILHPTPALGVSPRALGFEEMWRWDSPERRGRFGAPFGAVMHEAGKTPELHCVVAIRNVQWLGAQAEIGSGCGIVPASVADREWQELHLKRESVKRLLGL